MFNCLVCKNNVIVMGDAAGGIFVWNLKVRGASGKHGGDWGGFYHGSRPKPGVCKIFQLRTRRIITTTYTDVRKMLFSPTAASSKVMVQFQNGRRRMIGHAVHL